MAESKRTSHGCAFDAQPVSSSIDRRLDSGSASHRSSDNERVIQELPQANPQFDPSSPVSSVVDEEKEASSSVEQMKRWTLDLIKAMSVDRKERDRQYFVYWATFFLNSHLF